MTDISLDDLIQKDKQKNKAARKFKTSHERTPHQHKKRHITANRNDKFQHNSKNQSGDRTNKPLIKRRIIRKNNGARLISRKPYNDHRGSQNFNKPTKQRQQKSPQRQKNEEQKQDDEKSKHFKTLKVMGLSPEFTNEDLYKLFATEGAMEKCHIQQDNFGRSLTTAIVKYHSHQSAQNAIQNLNKHRIMNCVLTVQPYKFVKK